MEHRLIVTSECGYIYYMNNGEFSVFYDNSDETEYFSKIAKYDNNLFVVGGCKYINVFVSTDGVNYDLYKIDTKDVYYSEAVKFFDDFLTIVFSSHHSIMFIPVKEVYHGLWSNDFSLSKNFIAQLLPFHPLRFHSIGYRNGEFVIGGNFYNREILEGGVALVKDDFSSFTIHDYGWATTKVSVVDDKLYLLCNRIYGTDKKACLIVDGNVVCSFHESYELNDISVNDDYIYIVGRCIVGAEGTTINRGVVLILDRGYKLIDIYDVKGSGALLGCISMDVDYSNDKIITRSGNFIKTQIENDNVYMKVNLLRESANI